MNLARKQGCLWNILGSWDTPRTTLAFYGNPGPPCENGLSTHCHFSTKLILFTTWGSASTQRLHSFKFTLVNKSHSQHSVAAVHCEGRHFLILYACVHKVSFPGQIPVYHAHWSGNDTSAQAKLTARGSVSSRSSGQGS